MSEQEKISGVEERRIEGVVDEVSTSTLSPEVAQAALEELQGLVVAWKDKYPCAVLLSATINLGSESRCMVTDAVNGPGILSDHVRQSISLHLLKGLTSGKGNEAARG